MGLSLPRFLITFLLMALALAGCTPRNAPDGGTRRKGPQAAADVAYTDAIGRQVSLPAHPRRIISLAPSVTEVLYLLDAGDRLIGVTTHCQWPAEALAKPKIGDLLNPNFELILAAQPDLVIASTAGNDRAAVFKLAGLGLPVFVTAPRSVEMIFRTVEDIGRITDRASQGEQLVVRMKERLSQIRQRLAGLPATRAFFVTWFDPLLAPGRDTFETDVLRQAGVESITAGIDEFYPRCSLEQVMAQDPDAILSVERMGNPLPDLRRVAGWRRLSAVRAGRVYILNEALQHPSPRFVDAVEDLARKLHPERFP